MVSLESCRKYCKPGRISEVEGYAEAISSPLPYEIHHRNELQPDGTVVPREWLIDQHLYYGREPHELIFLEKSLHRHLHKGAFHAAPIFSEARANGIKKMQETKGSAENRAAQGARTRALWEDRETRDMMCSKMSSAFTPERKAVCADQMAARTATAGWKAASRNRKSATYVHLYGATRKELAAKLNISETKVKSLHLKGELKSWLG